MRPDTLCTCPGCAPGKSIPCTECPSNQLRVSLGQSEQPWVSHGRRWSWGMGEVRADGAAATRTGEAQKLRLSRASDSWLMSRQYGSRCRMKSTLWS